MSAFRFRAWPAESRQITQHFGQRPEYYAQFGLAGHEGVDFAATVGSNVFCVANGTVDHVYPDDGRPYGINVRVRHADGYESIYAHLQEASVNEGQRVRAGQIVGLAGLTGNTDGPHLHFTLKQADADLPGYPNHIIDPMPFLEPLLDPNWDDATFVRDLVPDGSIFQADASFPETWFLRNSGNHPWGTGYTLAHVQGPDLGAPATLALPTIPPLAEAPIAVQMTAPTQAGHYKTVWQPRTADGTLFGDPVWVDIEVPEPQAIGRGVLSNTTTSGSFVKAVGQEFMLEGRPLRFFGFNLRGLAHYGRRAADPLMLSRPEHQLLQLQAVYDLGARVVRIFLSDRTVARDELQSRLRGLLDLVDSHFPDLYLLPVFTNLYHDAPFQHPGDDEQWLFSNNLLSRDFFASRYRENYLPFVEQIVTAFRDDSNIFAWEIGNELKLDRGNPNNAADPNPWLFVRFNLETAAAIKRLDPNHMVTTGMKSTHHAWLHSPALQEELYGAPNIDFITIHSYEGKWDRDGDLRVYDDAPLAARCNKPFIVEEAGFDRELFPDRVAKHREHIERWLSLGAKGYLPWGFNRAHEIGDSDNSVGISSDHPDFQGLCDLFRTYAVQLNASSRGLARAFIPMPDSLPLPRGMRGVTGFDFQGYNQRFISNASGQPVNDAITYGVGVHAVNAPTGTSYWAVVGVHHLTPEENRSRHNIFVDVLDEQGQRLRDAQVAWNWEGNNGAPPEPKRLDKPDDEPGCDIPLFDGTFKLGIMGAPSEEVFGIHARHPDELAANGELLNTMGHHSFYVVFQRARKGGAQPVDGGGATTITPPKPVEIGPAGGAKVGRAVTRAAVKIGIDANTPIDEGSGSISAQVNDPTIIAGAGVGWVRINFIIGPWQDPHDQNRPFGKNWQETYQSVIDGFVDKGLKLYGLISDQALRNKPGGHLRSAPAGDLRGDAWIQSYANTFVTIARMFGDKVTVFESFNEPDDWKRNEQPGWSDANPNWIHPGWFATILQAVHDAVRSDPSLSRIRLVSGPLQGLDVNNNAGAEYLRRTYEEGKARYGWGQSGVPFPFDGVGYHLYIAEDARDNVGQKLRDKYKRYMDGLRTVIQTAEGSLKPIFISEIGWENPGDRDQLQQEAMHSAFDAIIADSSVALGVWFCTQDFPGKPYGIYRQGGLNQEQRKIIHDQLLAICDQQHELTMLDTVGAPMTEVLVDGATYVPGKDLILDGTVMQPGQPFVQSWTMRNSGQSTWGADYKLVWVADESMGAPHQVNVPACAPGGEVPVFVSLVAPTAPGDHKSTWRLCNDRNEVFGDSVWTVIKVAETRQLAPVAPTPLPAAQTELELTAALRKLWLTGVASTQQIFERLDVSLNVSPSAAPSQRLSEALTLASLGVAYHAYWTQIAGLTEGANRATILKEAAATAIDTINTLVAHQQGRGGGTPVAMLTPVQLPPKTTPPLAGVAGRRRALCIGIDTYAQQPLAGCVADARMWAETLTTLGFEAPTTLFNDQATRQQILQALQALVQQSQAGDVIVFQYAGHGTQLPDINKDEQGGDTPNQDEALVPYDFTQGAFVIDDDLAAVFAATPTGVNVTCFIDCCHSGTISRVLVGGPADSARPALDERPRFIVATPALIEAHQRFRQQVGVSRAARSRGPETMHEVVFSACQSTEVAWESNGHGEFTLRATGLLKTGLAGLNHEAYMERLVAAFGTTPRQHPMLDCAPAMRSGGLLQALVG